MAQAAEATAEPGLRIRSARRKDAERLAELCGQLGYPATTAQIGQRLRLLVPVSKHAVFVAETPSAGVIGWVHVSVWPVLEGGRRAEVNGLVVADGQRSLGAGAKLLEAAEEWARRQGCVAMNVRSNVIRERAHGFYLRQGYEHYKTQKAFRKPLR
jgi:GNAT superfamily N-acetyltransferase